MVESRKTGETQDRKAALSCAECRRSKLKCDRVFPCQSCIRRGCAHLCPDGMLAATKGNKVIMAHAQRLAEKVKRMSARIHELETALQQSSAAVGSTSHPSNPRVEEDHAYDLTIQDVSDGIGALSVGAEGRTSHGGSAGSEYFFDPIPPREGNFLQFPNHHLSNLPPEVIELMKAFPFGLEDCPHPKHIFTPFLPTRTRTLKLVDLYYKNVAWMYNPIVLDDFMKRIVDPIYGTEGLINLQDLHPHRLSVFFILVATGILYDDDCPSVLAERYYALSRAALASSSILVDATCTAVQALFMMVRYIHSPDRSSHETRWLLTGLCCRLAQTIGLDRDCAGWRLEPEEVQRRRSMFWELYTYDAWTGLVNGRPPALHIQHTDCRFPEDFDGVRIPTGNAEWSWHAWKIRYAATFLSTSVQHAFMTNSPQYSALLELDKKIRNFPLSHHLQVAIGPSVSNSIWSSDPSRAMQQYSAICQRDFNLLFLHRSYFARAIREQPKNPLQHKFAPSVLETYRSACRLISALKELYSMYPKLTSCVWFFWSAIFSSCIVLGALVAESPSCAVARDALQVLEGAVPFYEEGSRLCRPPAHIVMLQKLYQRAYSAYRDFHTGTPNRKPSPHSRSGTLNTSDEREVLDSRNSIVSTRSSPYATLSGSSPDLHGSIQTSNPESLNVSQETAQYTKGLFNTISHHIATQESPTGMFSAEMFAPDRQLFVGSPPYADLRSLEFSHAPSLREVISRHQSPVSWSTNPGQEGSIYAPLPYSQPNAQTLTESQTFTGQEDVWEDFIRRLGLMGADP